jgi:hypothetical protein
MLIRRHSILRPRHLAASLAAVLGFNLCVLQAGETSKDRPHLPVEIVGRSSDASGNTEYLPGRNPAARSVPIRAVTSCADDGSPGTLRYEIIHAQSGDTIDLSTLACSTITLDGNRQPTYLDIAQHSLYLMGPSDRHLTIDGGHHSAVFRHYGSGTFGITDLQVTNGYSVNNVMPLAGNGGCVYSAGNVSVTLSSIVGCIAASVIDGVRARGGGIYAHGTLTLLASTISGNKAITLGSVGPDGGGAFARGGVGMYYSTGLRQRGNREVRQRVQHGRRAACSCRRRDDYRIHLIGQSSRCRGRACRRWGPCLYGRNIEQHDFR